MAKTISDPYGRRITHVGLIEYNPWSKQSRSTAMSNRRRISRRDLVIGSDEFAKALDLRLYRPDSR